MLTPRLRTAAALGIALITIAGKTNAQDKDPEFKHTVNILVDCTLPDEILAGQLAVGVNAAIVKAHKDGIANINQNPATAQDFPDAMIAHLKAQKYIDIDISTDSTRPAGPRIACKPKRLDT